jgi:predicted ArsR family transcriptional regulator
MARLLAERGYEPRRDADGATTLRNCVFDQLAHQQRQLVCGMNLALLRGMLDAMPDAGLTARLEPAEGRCCVVLEPAGPQSPADAADETGHRET